MSRQTFIAISMALMNWIIAHNGVAQTVSPSSKELSEKTHNAQELLDRYYGNQANIAKAQEYIVEVLKAEPRFVPAYVQAARITIMGGHIVSYTFTGGTVERAEAILLKAKELEPGNAEIYGLLGHVYFLKGTMDAAIQSLNTANQLKSSNPWLNNNYGVGRNNLALGLYGKWASLMAQGRGPEGEKYFGEAFALKPDLANVVQRFRQSAQVVIDLAPIVQKRQAETRR